MLSSLSRASARSMKARTSSTVGEPGVRADTERRTAHAPARVTMARSALRIREVREGIEFREFIHRELGEFGEEEGSDPASHAMPRANARMHACRTGSATEFGEVAAGDQPVTDARDRHARTGSRRVEPTRPSPARPAARAAPNRPRDTLPDLPELPVEELPDLEQDSLLLDPRRCSHRLCATSIRRP
jgi:hypothetical protein